MALQSTLLGKKYRKGIYSWYYNTGTQSFIQNSKIRAFSPWMSIHQNSCLAPNKIQHNLLLIHTMSLCVNAPTSQAYLCCSQIFFNFNFFDSTENNKITERWWHWSTVSRILNLVILCFYYIYVKIVYTWHHLMLEIGYFLQEVSEGVANKSKWHTQGYQRNAEPLSGLQHI